MTDTSRSGALVKRLRDPMPPHHGKCLKAADRIEALETQLESANEALREQLDIRATLEAENERLRGANQAAAECVAAMMEECARYRDEIRAALGEKQ